VTGARELLDAEATLTRRAVQARARRHIHFGADARQLVLFQLAGNDFSVVCAAFGRPGRRADHVIACPDPLDRGRVAADLAPLRSDLLGWLRCHRVDADHSDPNNVSFSADATPQLIVAGTGVITALSNLAYDWRFNDEADQDLADLGEELWALTDLRYHPGQAAIIPLAEALAEHWAYGLSPQEALKLSVAVAFLDAGPGGLSRAGLRDAERCESGPIGDPHLLDTPVWRALSARRNRAPATVTTTLRETWEHCNRAWAHLSSLPEAASAPRAHAPCTSTWARRIGPLRTGLGYRRRRAVPALASAATTLVRLEREAAQRAADAALEDPMIAAERAAEGRAARAALQFNVQKNGRATAITITGAAAQSLPPVDDRLYGISGTRAVARLAQVRPATGGGWLLRLELGGNVRGTTGIREASRLPDGTYWLVEVPRPGPPGLSAPLTPPATHPFARQRPSASAQQP
jgi:hypothetical protein